MCGKEACFGSGGSGCVSLESPPESLLRRQMGGRELPEWGWQGAALAAAGPAPVPQAPPHSGRRPTAPSTRDLCPSVLSLGACCPILVTCVQAPSV